MMNRIRLFRGLSLALALTATGARGDELFNTNEAELIEVLKSGEPAQKAIACKKLAVFGTKDSVPLLEPLLADEQLASWARIALEAINDPAADEALRNSLKEAKGNLAIGTVNSLGFRRDAAAVPQLSAAFAASVTADDAEATDAAAWALGRIATAEAIETLRGGLKSEKDAVRNAAAQGVVLAAEQLLAQGKDTEAAKLYDEARAAEVPTQRKLEATRGAILARGDAGIPLLLEQLRSDDKKFLQLGLGTARELPGQQVADALVKELETAPTDRAALLIYALADRKELADAPAILQAAVDGDKPIQLAAMKLLARVDDADNVDALLQAAADEDVEVADAATRALADMNGDQINAHLGELLPRAKGKQLVVLLNLVGKRRLQAADALNGALAQEDAAIRAAALTALGETVGPEQLDLLVKQCLTPRDSADAPTAWRALKAASIRMPDRDACAATLAAAMSDASPAAQAQLVEILGAVGGPTALKSIAAAMKEGDDKVLDAGTRTLGQWMELDAGPVLLDLAKTTPAEKYQVRALRAYIRIARQFRMADETRAEMCAQALEAASRPEEQQLVFAVLERYPNESSLGVAKAAAERAELKAEATRVAAAIEQKLSGN